MGEPSVLGSLSRHDMELRMGKGWAGDQLLFSLWTLAAGRVAPADWAISLPANAFRLAGLITGGSPEESALGRRLADLEGSIGLGQGAAKGIAPREWGARLCMLGLTHAKRRGLVEHTAAFNALCSFGRSLPSVASALRSWGGFCDALGVAHFPVTSELAREYARAHREAETYAVYLGHVRKACELLGMDTGWARDSSVKAAKRGLAAQRIQFKPLMEAVGAADLARLLRLRTSVSGPRIFVSMAWVFMLRAASEATGVIRVSDNCSALDAHMPHEADAVMGLWGGELVLRLKRRKNRPRGDRVVRACSCGGQGGLSRHCGEGLCPLCHFWPLIRRKFAIGDRLFADGIAARAAEWLRRGLRDIGVPRWDRYTLHALRRGAARALVEKGGDLADLCRAGSWNSSAVLKFYLDMKDLEKRALAGGGAAETSSEEE